MRLIFRICAVALFLAMCQAASVRADDAPKTDIDMNRVRELYQREQKGEKLSAEDQAYLDKAKALMQGRRGNGENPPQGRKPEAPAGDAAAGLDMERVKDLYKRSHTGEKLSAEDQAYLDKALASMKSRRGNGENAPPRGNPQVPDEGARAGIDWNRARDLHQRERNGEKLSAEDQAYLDKAKAALQNGARPDGAPRPEGGARPEGAGARGAQPVSVAGKDSVGITPLSDLGAGDKYKDQDGGLYGAGQNHPTGDLLKLAQTTAASIKPLNADGASSPDGKIVLLTIGMSNTTMESAVFKKLADEDARKSPDVVIVDGAQGGKDAAAWANSPRNQPVWQVADGRLSAAGVSAKQVQVLWIKQALMGPANHGEFPKHAEDLKTDVENILLLAKQRYPNVKIAYLSSRIYAGFASTPLNPEPYAYEGAFSMRWVIQDQAKSDSPINADPSKGAVKAPLALWGPYLWADGVKGRKTDALTYERKDLGSDGTHPSESGRQKVAELLVNFFVSDETTKGWFVRK